MRAFLRRVLHKDQIMVHDIKSRQIQNLYGKKQQTQSFKGGADVLFSTIDKGLKPLDSFIKMQENLSGTRFVQDTITNWVPKAVFTRSKADLAEMSLLEFGESAIFYFAPGLLGEHVSRKVFSKFLPKNMRKELGSHISDSADQILSNKQLLKSGADKRLLPIKAAIALSCVCIPAAEYALSFAKNLFTLKVFKKSDFNNIANLNKDQKENKEQQQRVEKSAKAHIAKAAAISTAALGTAFVFAAFGHKSKTIQTLSKGFLQPGAAISKGLEKAGFKSNKLDKFLKSYINFDFDSRKGKLALSHGQLAASVIAGVFGYNAAAKDRGRLDQLEVMTRLPLVAFYTIFGSELFEKGFKHILYKKKAFPDLIKKAADNTLSVPTREQLPELAKNLALKNQSKTEDEMKKLIKGKAFITAVPFVFSLAFMGFALAGISRFWTQYRYNHSNKADENKQQNEKPKNSFEKRASATFSSFS